MVNYIYCTDKKVHIGFNDIAMVDDAMVDDAMVDDTMVDKCLGCKVKSNPLPKIYSWCIAPFKGPWVVRSGLEAPHFPTSPVTVGVGP